MIRIPSLILMLSVALASLAGQAPARETIQTRDGATVEGLLSGDAATGFLFQPQAGGAGIPLKTLDAVRFTPVVVESTPTPPIQVDLGLSGRISGTLLSLDDKTLRLTDGPGTTTRLIDRAGVRALQQRPGEAQVLADAFTTLRESVWTQVGTPEIAPNGRSEGVPSLRLPAAGAAITHRLASPLWSGRLRLAFHDDATLQPGQLWFLDLTFRGPDGQESIQILPGWENPTLGVRSRGNGPALAIQPLSRSAGWHVLTARFGPDGTDIAVDGNELAHGAPPGGPLLEIRLATESRPGSAPPTDLAALAADLRLVRLAAPHGPPEIDPSQDDVRLLNGDQLFGTLLGADRDSVSLRIAGDATKLPWSEIAGLDLRRVDDASAAAPLSGLWVRLTWQPPGASASADWNSVEGVLDAVDRETLTIQVPYAGSIQVPRAQAVELLPMGEALRQVLDPSSHHLGNAFVTDLNPPQPEGPSWSLTFNVDAPERFDRLAFDVVQLIGVEGNLDFSQQVRDGQLLTRVFVNDREIDNLNRHLHTPNTAPERIRVALPPGTLKTGPNTVRLALSGLASDPNTLDNFGLVGVALEGPTAKKREGPLP